MNNYILIGCPGSGKGTLADEMSKYGYLKINTGDCLRSEVNNNTSLGIKIQKDLNEGIFISDQDVWESILPSLNNAIKSKQKFTLDAFPQNLGKLELLKTFLKDNKLVNTVQFFIFRVDKSLALQRIQGRLTCQNCTKVYNEISKKPKKALKCDHCCGTLIKRPEDNLNKSTERIENFYNITAPIVGVIKRQFASIDINSNINENAIEKLSSNESICQIK
ncbi:MULTISPECIES: adenylate kinase family protein [unclassified Wolbachia]|uniref:adenylate kinase family protein n=1 Tax=unclassified Wolbachia TaxID=2640676 RepID=UPI0029C9FEBF|nr:nucleoside monophosphate kinase [Wolbachia endosymbiont (group B) of Idaea aversata]